MKRFYRLVLAVFFLAILCGVWADEIRSGYVTVTDEAGKIIFETGHNVEIGDEFLDEENQLYEIISLSGTSAKTGVVNQHRPPA